MGYYYGKFYNFIKLQNIVWIKLKKSTSKSQTCVSKRRSNPVIVSTVVYIYINRVFCVIDLPGPNITTPQPNKITLLEHSPPPPLISAQYPSKWALLLHLTSLHYSKHLIQLITELWLVIELKHKFQVNFYYLQQSAVEELKNVQT